jgi:hypothetical protein
MQKARQVNKMQIIALFLICITMMKVWVNFLYKSNEKETKISEPPRLGCDSTCDDEKIKVWYQQKYGEPITDLELSITKVDFKSEEGKDCKPLKRKRPENKHSKSKSIIVEPAVRSLPPRIYIWNSKYIQHFNISITKTATNALLTLTKTTTGRPQKYLPKDVEGQFESEINMEEWLDLIRILYRLTNEWEKEYGEYGLTAYTSTFGELCVKKWFLDIYFSGKNKPAKFRGIEAYPSNWLEFKEIIDGMEAKLNEEMAASAMPASKAKMPYEATWLHIEKTDNGYVVYNYLSMWGDRKTKSPEMFRAKGDSLIWITYSDDPAGFVYKFSNVVELNDSSYSFNSKGSGATFRFDYVDKANHIARWRLYYNPDKPQRDDIYNLYIDSLYNTFPIVDYEWKEGPIDGF